MAVLKIAPQSLAKRPPLYHPKLPFVLFWSEKSGCTVAAKWFFHQLGLLEEAIAYHPWIHNYENEVFKKRSGYLDKCVDALKAGAPAIKLVRNPYARAFSGYLEVCRSFLVRQTDHWAYGTRQDILRYLVGYDQEIEYAFSFNQFVSWLGAQDTWNMNLHLAPQREAYEAHLDIEPVHIEVGHAAYAKIEERFSLRPTTPDHPIFTSGHHHPKTQITGPRAVDICDLAIPVQRLRSFQLIAPDPSQIRQTASGEILRKTFAGDFAAYKYEE